MEIIEEIDDNNEIEFKNHSKNDNYKSLIEKENINILKSPENETVSIEKENLIVGFSSREVKSEMIIEKSIEKSKFEQNNDRNLKNSLALPNQIKEEKQSDFDDSNMSLGRPRKKSQPILKSSRKGLIFIELVKIPNN